MTLGGFGPFFCSHPKISTLTKILPRWGPALHELRLEGSFLLHSIPALDAPADDVCRLKTQLVSWGRKEGAEAPFDSICAKDATAVS